MKNKKQYIAKLELIINSDEGLIYRYERNMGKVRNSWDDPWNIKCAEKTLRDYQKDATKILEKIKEALAVS